MVRDVSAALDLIRHIEQKPQLLDKSTGVLLSIDVGEAALVVADDAARRKDLDTLGWLWNLLIYDFTVLRERQLPDGASFIDVYEYVTDLEYILRDNEDPFKNTVLMQYRQSIVDDLKQVRKELA